MLILLPSIYSGLSIDRLGPLAGIVKALEITGAAEARTCYIYSVPKYNFFSPTDPRSPVPVASDPLLIQKFSRIHLQVLARVCTSDGGVGVQPDNAAAGMTTIICTYKCAQNHPMGCSYSSRFSGSTPLGIGSIPRLGRSMSWHSPANSLSISLTVVTLSTLPSLFMFLEKLSVAAKAVFTLALVDRAVATT